MRDRFLEFHSGTAQNQRDCLRRGWRITSAAVLLNFQLEPTVDTASKGTMSSSSSSASGAGAGSAGAFLGRGMALPGDSGRNSRSWELRTQKWQRSP